MILFWPILILLFINKSQSILYPRPSESREQITLDGLWNFLIDKNSTGHKQEWFKKDLDKLFNFDVLLMPVPSSYNDIVEDIKIRDHVGIVWYDRSFFVPLSWYYQRVWLRFSSVHYSAEVWINGELAVVHRIGHLPFEIEVTDFLEYGSSNKISVACDNTLIQTTIPQGYVDEVETDDETRITQTYTFDFYNYAGIHRSVILYTTPNNYIKDITVQTKLTKDNEGQISYEVETNDPDNFVGVKLYDKKGNYVVSNTTGEGILIVERPNLWWPYLMHPNPGYLYELEVQLLNNKSEVIDIYRLPVGIRDLKWDNSTFTINNKPIYLHGFGKHEDADIRGKGFDYPTIIKDFNLIKWIGGNCFRTSHYPYSDEIMDLADQFGIMVINECPAVNIEKFSTELQLAHMQSITELIRRDKNRPSVIAWSIANEPRSESSGADTYFKVIANHAKSLDCTRPITASLFANYKSDKVATFLDIISFNRYNGWYLNEGQLDMIISNVIVEAAAWREKFRKPIIMSEYGADTIIGLHSLPPSVWSEEYHVELLSRHFHAFDILRKKSWFIGEFVWNFADFKTAQSVMRVDGNKKGIFTRNRQPKAAAYHLRKRYFTLANELYKTPLPKNINHYIARNFVDEL